MFHTVRRLRGRIASNNCFGPLEIPPPDGDLGQVQERRHEPTVGRRGRLEVIPGHRFRLSHARWDEMVVGLAECREGLGPVRRLFERRLERRDGAVGHSGLVGADPIEEGGVALRKQVRMRRNGPQKTLDRCRVVGPFRRESSLQCGEGEQRIPLDGTGVVSLRLAIPRAPVRPLALQERRDCRRSPVTNG